VGAARVFVIAGQLAAGKSTVARAVLDRFDSVFWSMSTPYGRW